jgi:transcriptional regulator with XRE-family HTH domain
VKSTERVQIAFGKALRKARRAQGISQEALADLAGLHRTYIGDVERGERNISLVNMAKIARALHIKLSALVRDSEKHVGK